MVHFTKTMYSQEHMEKTSNLCVSGKLKFANI